MRTEHINVIFVNLILKFSLSILSGALLAGYLGHQLYRGVKETGVLKYVGRRHEDSYES